MARGGCESGVTGLLKALRPGRHGSGSGSVGVRTLALVALFMSATFYYVSTLSIVLMVAKVNILASVILGLR